jgi:hypothetical protein
MTLDAHFVRVLGTDLRKLAPLIAEAVRTLDRPGSRALRYKLDGAFNCAARAYNAALLSESSEEDWHPTDHVRYDRVTPLRSEGRACGKTAGAVGGSTEAVWYERAGLRLVVDNGPESPPFADRSRGPTVADNPALLAAKVARVRGKSRRSFGKTGGGGHDAA